MHRSRLSRTLRCTDTPQEQSDGTDRGYEARPIACRGRLCRARGLSHAAVPAGARGGHRTGHRRAYAGSTSRASRRAPATPAPGAYDGFRFEQVGVGVKRVVDDGAGHRPERLSADRAVPQRRSRTSIIMAVEADGSVITCCRLILSSMRETLTASIEMHRLGERERRWRAGGTRRTHRSPDDIADMAAGPGWIRCGSPTMAGIANLERGDWNWRLVEEPRATSSPAGSRRQLSGRTGPGGRQLAIMRHEEGRAALGASPVMGLPRAVGEVGRHGHRHRDALRMDRSGLGRRLMARG